MVNPINPRYTSYIRSPETPKLNTVASFAQQWAKKYVQTQDGDFQKSDVSTTSHQKHKSRFAKRLENAEHLSHSLRLAVSQAWSKTEMILAVAIKQNQIDPQLVNGWEIAADAHKIYEKVLEFYADGETPEALAAAVGKELVNLTQCYRTPDPRVLGFVNLLFHHTGLLLLQEVSGAEQALLGNYIKVIEDHLNMPLVRLYDAAGTHSADSPALLAVIQLLPAISEIAQIVSGRIQKMYPNYRTFTGKLSDDIVSRSSLRDIEMFQVYLWTCVLEGNLSAITEELFPLCVLLYPALKVDWELVRQMLYLLAQEISGHLSEESRSFFVPYFSACWEMFSPEVFATENKQETSIEGLGNWVAG
ncbi:MAG TPA: hypothetical protein V6D13_19540 [Halomicronema sp.]